MGVVLRPLDEGRFGRREAAHLLRRAGFGGSRDEVTALQVMGVENAVDYLLGSASSKSSEPSVAVATPTFGCELDQLRSMERWWLKQIATSPRPVDERLALMWHDHFATSYSVVGISAFMRQQHRLFRTHGTLSGGDASFAKLAKGIVRDAAMARFLDADGNRKEHPNENLAREFMELFTLGTGNYTESDVKEAARALTGLGMSLEGEVRFAAEHHDGGEKTILGKRGPWRPDDLPSLVLERPACAKHVARRLFRTFVADWGTTRVPAGDVDAVLDALASLIREENYGFRSALKALFLSEFFYSPNVVGRMVKSPVQLVAGAVRELGAPLRDVTVVLDSMAAMGQRLFDPPSVAGWDSGLTWISTATLLARQNVCIYLLTGRMPVGGDRGYADTERAGFNAEELLAGLSHEDRSRPEKIVDRLLDHALAVESAPLSHVGEASNATFKTSGGARDELIRYAAAFKSSSSPEAICGLLVLIVSLPEYQFC